METGVPVILAESPLTCVAIGCGKFIEETKNLKDLIEDTLNRKNYKSFINIADTHNRESFYKT